MTASGPDRAQRLLHLLRTDPPPGQGGAQSVQELLPLLGVLRQHGRQLADGDREREHEDDEPPVDDEHGHRDREPAPHPAARQRTDQRMGHDGQDERQATGPRTARVAWTPRSATAAPATPRTTVSHSG
ncbi:hypothetical protein [Geodermatophilus marinus]|uniref:hypothetical protein n=1 Tax=Geodermatophilus sp. LHW52908 TaxID=2303986 RepID=UPI001F42F4F3|nr:hypothetical protein [Geodermatophilus sp. LHW52908]